MKRISILLMAFSLVACKKDEEVKTNTAPSIEFVSFSEEEVTEFENSITMTISYDDLEGDLGFDDPDELALEVKDSRLDTPDFYFVKPLAPLGHQLHIQGNLEVKLSTFFLLGNGAEENSVLKVKIRDRAGNFSNEISTPPIKIIKE